MNRPIDVLAVMDRLIAEYFDDDNVTQDERDFKAARAAVAELIEALREIADVTTPGDGVPNEVWINERANKALANIGETK